MGYWGTARTKKKKKLLWKFRLVRVGVGIWIRFFLSFCRTWDWSRDPDFITDKMSIARPTDNSDGPHRDPLVFLRSWVVVVVLECRDFFVTLDFIVTNASCVCIICIRLTFHTITMKYTVNGRSNTGANAYGQESRNRGRFTQGLKSNGMRLRWAGTETLEKIGRRERHEGIIKHMLKVTMMEHHVIRKNQRSQYAIIAQMIKNDRMRKGDFFFFFFPMCLSEDSSTISFTRWRGRVETTRSAHITQDTTTEFGFKVRLRMWMQKVSDRIFYGRRYVAAIIRKTKSLDKEGLLITCGRIVLNVRILFRICLQNLEWQSIVFQWLRNVSDSWERTSSKRSELIQLVFLILTVL